MEDKLPDGKKVVEKARAEHQLVKEDLFKLDKLGRHEEAFEQLAKKVMTELGEHIEDEENVEIPKLVSVLHEDEQIRLGKEFERMKKFVPTR